MKKNNIFIDTSFVYLNKSGIGVYVDMLIDIISKSNYSYKIYNFKYPEMFYNIKYIIYIIWLNTFFYIRTLFLKPSIFIFPSFIMPYFIHKHHKYYTVIHDLAGFRNNEMTLHARLINQLSILITLKKASLIITVSDTIKQELINKFNVDNEHIKVVSNTIGQHFKNVDIDVTYDIFRKYKITKYKYILSVATLNKRKNIPELIKAFKLISDRYPDIKLVLVGSMGNENREKLVKHSNIIFTGYIKDEEIPILYKNALFFVFPSLYEGFGIPLIEAQYSSCPLLCSNIPVFKEVASSGAEYVEPDSISIAKKIEYLINNEARRREIILLGLKNVKRFSYENLSKQLINLLEK